MAVYSPERNGRSRPIAPLKVGYRADWLKTGLGRFKPAEINEGGSASRSPVATSEPWFIVLRLQPVRQRKLSPVDRDSRSTQKRSGSVCHDPAERIAH